MPEEARPADWQTYLSALELILAAFGLLVQIAHGAEVAPKRLGRQASANYDAEARKGTWHAETADHGPSLPASLDFSARSMLLPATYPDRALIPGASARLMGFELPRPPVADILETVAEKLSRFRRVMLGRDVYDLSAVARCVDGRLPLLREVLCFKAYFDRVEEGHDTLPVPFAGGTEFAGRDPGKVVGAEDLGLLARDHVDIAAMLRTIEGFYQGIGAPTGETEVRLATCRFDDLYWARTRYTERAAELRARHGGVTPGGRVPRLV